MDDKPKKPREQIIAELQRAKEEMQKVIEFLDGMQNENDKRNQGADR